LPRKTGQSHGEKGAAGETGDIPVGDSRPDWKILCDLSTKMGYLMTYSGPAEVMEEIASLVPFYGDDVSPPEGWNPAVLRNDGKRKFFPVDYRDPVERLMKPIRCGHSRRVSLPLWNRNNHQEGRRPARIILIPVSTFIRRMLPRQD
jgi:hypothetical protein